MRVTCKCQACTFLPWYYSLTRRLRTRTVEGARAMSTPTPDIPTICLTGGPCAGKSTLLAWLEERLSDLGFTVVTVREGATSFKSSGLTPARMKVERFQTHLFAYQIEREERFRAAAQDIAAEKIVLLCDRGAHDAAAYMTPDEYKTLLTAHGTTHVAARDERYDAVIFLRSVATDAPHLYTCTNNAARTETIEEAREQDARTLAAWVGHPHLRVIDNSSDLAGKGARALAAICRVLGVPAPLEIERKYLLPPGFTYEPAGPSHTVEVTQQYLRAHDGVTRRIRARGGGGAYVYYYTEKEKLRAGVRMERERRISKDEYERLTTERDPALGIIRKKRMCFVYEGQYFELDTFDEPHGLVVLELELTDEADTVHVPPELKDLARDVTDDPAYTNFAIAKRIGLG